MSEKVRIAINGFGRIGRQAFKVALEKDELEIIAVNDLTPARVLAHLLKYDSVYGIYDKKIEVEEAGEVVAIEGNQPTDEHFAEPTGKLGHLLVDGRRTQVLAEKEPSQLPWRDLDIDVVLECTGRFTRDRAAAAHLEAGAKRVVVSAPTKGAGDVGTFLLGVNADRYQGEDVISNASCTTNCVGPVAAVMHAQFKVLKAAMTTIHSVTAEQNLVDGGPPGLHQDLRRGRAAAHNIVPTTTGAAIATTKAIPELEGLFDGVAVRVPTLCGSITDFTFLVSQKVGVAEVNQAFRDANRNPLYEGILEVTEEPLVSSDIIGNPASAIVDLSVTKVIDGDLVKVLAWYDNEWGYSNRLVELAIQVGQQLQ